MTSFNTVINRLLRRIEKEPDFFACYNNVSMSEVEELVRTQAEGYIYDAIDKIYNVMTPDIDWYDFDIELQQFNVDLTTREIGLLSSLMYQVYLERQEALLGAFKIRMSPSDVNTITPSTERRTFMELCEKVRHENDIALSHYASTDRLTGEHKSIDHSQYDYES